MLVHFTYTPQNKLTLDPLNNSVGIIKTKYQQIVSSEKFGDKNH